ncbi:HNH endonuclease signature motif containing protein [Glycomyces paridis]|nr:HNH endonuclease signature motif containing protein [Glycomyces paridis]
MNTPEATHTPAPSRFAPPPALVTDRRTRAAEIRSALDQAADLINTQHAQVLEAVIAMHDQHLHRDQFGFSALRDLLLAEFAFTFDTAGQVAAIARLSRKFALLAQAATTGAARIDRVAYAVRQLDKTPAMRLFARTPFRTPVASPFNPDRSCATPEAVISEYCAPATFTELRTHLDGLAASLAEEAELLDGLGEQALQRLELTEQDNSMWSLEATLTETTGRLLDKYLKTACPPPRQDETDTDGDLAPQANRHGHTATLDLTVDRQTLQGKDTGRLPLLEGKPISVAQARLLACEAGIIPSVFNYATGEAVELGRALRLPNVALRRKLELEQPGGCAWQGCERPISWTEAHHIEHWADGGATIAENLILLCRFHHGRIHTQGWSITKTGPGKALIVHPDHEGTTDSGAAAADATAGVGSGGCGCADWRTDTDLDAAHTAAGEDLLPLGLYPSEWSESLKPELRGWADMADRTRTIKAMNDAKARARARFAIKDRVAAGESGSALVPSQTSDPRKSPADTGGPPGLPGPQRAAVEGKRHPIVEAPPEPDRAGPLTMSDPRAEYPAQATTRPSSLRFLSASITEPQGPKASPNDNRLLVAAIPDLGHHRTPRSNTEPRRRQPAHRCHPSP